MSYLKVAIDDESLEQLAALAIRERRPLLWQAEVLLLKALGRWPVSDDRQKAVAIEGAATVPTDAA